MLKTGQNWGKIANYPPRCSTMIGTPAKMVWPCKQNASGKTSKQALLAKASGKKTVGQPRTAVEYASISY